MEPRPVRTIVLCGEDAEAVSLHDALMRQGYAVLAVNDGRQALIALARRRRMDALALDYAISDMNGGETALEMKRVRPELPMMLFSGSPETPAKVLAQVDAMVAKGEETKNVLSVLERLLPMTNAQVRRFPRHPVQMPFAVTANRSDSPIFQGVSTSFGEGGLGGKLDGTLVPGEYVRIRISDPRLAAPLEPRAQVCYRRAGVYGFAFMDVNALQQADVRRLCSVAAMA